MSCDKDISPVDAPSGEVKSGPLKGFKILSDGEKYSVEDENGNTIEFPEFPSKFYLRKRDDNYHFYAMWSTKNPTKRSKETTPKRKPAPF